MPELPSYSSLFPETLVRDPINPTTTVPDNDPLPSSDCLEEFYKVNEWLERSPYNQFVGHFCGLFDPLPPPAPLSHPILQIPALLNNQPPPYISNPDYDPNAFQVDVNGNPLFPHDDTDPYDLEDPDDPIPIQYFASYYIILHYLSRNPYVDIFSQI